MVANKIDVPGAEEVADRLAERVREERTQAIAGYLRQLGSEDAAHLVRIVRRTTDILEEHSERAGSEGGAA